MSVVIIYLKRAFVTIALLVTLVARLLLPQAVAHAVPVPDVAVSIDPTAYEQCQRNATRDACQSPFNFLPATPQF